MKNLLQDNKTFVRHWKRRVQRKWVTVFFTTWQISCWTLLLCNGTWNHCAPTHNLPREETSSKDNQPRVISRWIQQKLPAVRKQKNKVLSSRVLWSSANKSGDKSIAFTLNELLFHWRTRQDCGNRLFKVLGTVDEYIQGSCSSIFVHFNLPHACKWKSDKILEEPGDQKNFWELLCKAPTDTYTGLAATGATYMWQ